MGEFGMLTRKHHCRFCGLVICADCLKTKTEHPKTKEQESCCDRCVPEWCPAEEVIDAQDAAVQDAREAKLCDLCKTKADADEAAAEAAAEAQRTKRQSAT